MRLMRMIGFGLTAYSAYKMIKGMSGARSGRAPAMRRASTRPGIDLMKRHV